MKYYFLNEIIIIFKLFIELLTKQEHMVTAFDEKLFNILVEKMVIYTKDKVEVHFKNGQVIEI